MSEERRDPLLLMTPGPTRVPERVLRAGARPMLHHRSPEFRRELAELLVLLAPVFGTTATPLPVHTTGRGAMEAAICNLCSPGDEIIACCNGKFGEMWARLAESYGVVVHRVSTNWGRAIDPLDVDRAVHDHPAARAVTLAYCDSSTGVRNDVAAVSRVARAHDVLTFVDGVPAIGGMPFAFDEWEVDVVVTASQKCLMSSPGLSFAVLSDRAWKAHATSRFPRNYWNFGDIRTSVSKPIPETPGTTPVHLVLQVAEALRMIHEEGLSSVFERHERMAQRTRAGAQALGLVHQCPEIESVSPVLTALALPMGIAPSVVRDGLKRRGILTAAALGPYEPHAFRIGHMGDIRLSDVDRTLDALSEVMAECAQGAIAQ